MKSIGYYPGCSLGGTAREYDLSLKAVAGRLGIELKEVPDWVCCGATSAHAVDPDAAICLAADTLAKASRAGIKQLLAPCAMCFQRLAAASHEIGHKPGLDKNIAAALGESPDLDLKRVQPVSLLYWLSEMSDEQIKEKVVKPLHGLKVACYYGCLLVRPPKITGEKQVETPRSMERIVKLLGGESVRWTMAMECCGGSFAVSNKAAVLRQGQKIYQSAKKASAEVICMACPMCHSNLDVRQAEFKSAMEGPLPVLYLTQLIGLAMGLSKQELGLGMHFVPVDPVLAKV